ncbi:FAD/NAD-P-binding domain-containing protein [Mycena olivaceomarginata]|nr:FAD/NAD-P-binding domain-containing protein [Mycena olivaceomarginata]
MAARPCLCYIMRLAVVAQLRSNRMSRTKWEYLLSTQSQDVFETPKPLWPMFDHPIRRVAFVGAGPAGLQAAAKLIEHNFTVRLFERAPHPGGNCLYSEETPMDGALATSSLWKSLHINTPKVSTELPDVKYDPDTPWVVSHHAVQRHVRSYASHHCLNSNDYCPATASAPPATAYSTRVEKDPGRMVDGDIRCGGSCTGPYTAPHVPDIDGIVDWSKATEGGQYSGISLAGIPASGTVCGQGAPGKLLTCATLIYRKTVLIVGASVSASEIARDIVSSLPTIVCQACGSSTLSRFPNITEFVPEIAFLEPLSGHRNGIRSGKIHLINGSVLQGIDEIILATGFRGYSLFPPNSASLDFGAIPIIRAREGVEGQRAFAHVEQMKLEEEYWREWLGEEVFRRYITWLNNASLEHGGRFVEPPPIENLEILKYYMFVYLLNLTCVPIWNTMNLDSIGNFDISMLSGQLGDKDAWDALVDEDDDW